MSGKNSTKEHKMDIKTPARALSSLAAHTHGWHGPTYVEMINVKV